jgi:hypothetical protein
MANNSGGKSIWSILRYFDKNAGFTGSRPVGYNEGVGSELVDDITVAYCLRLLIQDKQQVAIKLIVELLRVRRPAPVQDPRSLGPAGILLEIDYLRGHPRPAVHILAQVLQPRFLIGGGALLQTISLFHQLPVAYNALGGNRELKQSDESK